MMLKHALLPGYVGFITYVAFTPLLLGSWWGLITGVTNVGLIVLRTALENRTLHRELDGYPAYAELVRYRLLSGVW